jgi:hypothetical protein
MATFKLRTVGVRCGNCDLPARELSSLTRSSVHLLVCRPCYTHLTATAPPSERPPRARSRAPLRGTAFPEPSVQRCLAEIDFALAAAGWTPADHALSTDDGDGIDLLAYQATAADGRHWRLDICGLRQVVTAEPWSPRDLAAIDDVTRRHRRWQCDPDGDQEAQGRAIAAWVDRKVTTG